MNADLENLILLQALDIDLKRLRAELADAPVRVLAAQTARAKAEVALNAAKTALSKEQVLRNSQQTDTATHRGKIARLNKQLESATSAAQITALEHEVQFAQAAISKLEDEELESLERTDQQEAARAASTDLLALTTSALEAQRAKAAALTTTNTAMIAELEAERATLRTSIASTEDGDRALSNYDRIAKGKGTAISEAVNHKCTACQMMVRPQRWNDLTDRDPNGEFANSIFNCETCGRMLFYDPRQDAPTPWPAGDRLKAALHP
ncbi:MAG: C4-type zinc ribbon domain-containing protein [Acidobacteriota bacterium]